MSPATLLKQKAGIDMQHVPYRARPRYRGPSVGQGADEFHRSLRRPSLGAQGKIRPLAIASEARDPKAPGYSHLREEGRAGFYRCHIYRSHGPAGTPPAIVASSTAPINAVLAEAETRAMLGKPRSFVRPGTVEGVRAFLAAEQHKWEGLASLASTNAE